MKEAHWKLRLFQSFENELTKVLRLKKQKPFMHYLDVKTGKRYFVLGFCNFFSDYSF